MVLWHYSFALSANAKYPQKSPEKGRMTGIGLAKLPPEFGTRITRMDE
jgi:hypothetical protein